MFEEEDDTIEEEGAEERMRAAIEKYTEAEDRQGPITISMFVYYTTAFKNAVPDVKGFIDQVGVLTVGKYMLVVSRVQTRIYLKKIIEQCRLLERQTLA